MKHLEKALIIDAGNTRIKLALASNGEIKEVFYFQNSELQLFKRFLRDYKEFPSIVASVREEKHTQWILNLLPKSHRFSVNSALNLDIDYETPHSLGVDRIANAVAANFLAKNNSLVIDIGTCVKYDLVINNVYIGGVISPGLNMRYQSLHQFTGKLPLVNLLEADVIGKSTESCIASGVINGMKNEIDGFISSLCQKYENLTLFLTGGDRLHFDLDRKSDIFVRENLTLEGLLIVLTNVVSNTSAF